MVSLAVVVAAILAVLVLVFSDQPATQRVKGRRGARNGRHSAPSLALSASSSQPASSLVLRGPPPAHVLQHQLALPSAKPRAPRPTPSATPRGAPTTTAPQSERADTATVADETYDVRLAKDEDVTFLSRARSSAALVVLLAAVGTAVALAIGSVLYLAGLALRHTLR
jgi:hypothetical protein